MFPIPLGFDAQNFTQLPLQPLAGSNMCIYWLQLAICHQCFYHLAPWWRRHAPSVLMCCSTI